MAKRELSRCYPWEQSRLWNICAGVYISVVSKFSMLICAWSHIVLCFLNLKLWPSGRLANVPTYLNWYSVKESELCDRNILELSQTYMDFSDRYLKHLESNTFDKSDTTDAEKRIWWLVICQRNSNHFCNWETLTRCWALHNSSVPIQLRRRPGLCNIQNSIVQSIRIRIILN